MRINLNHLSMIYPNGRQALKDISLTLESPSLIGLVGPNGAGKSTLMKLLVAGLLPTGGTISVDDVPLSRCEKKLKEKLGYLPQDFGLYDELTVREFLDYMAALKGIRDSKAAIESAILATGLEEKRKARIKTLSGGQRQRVALARAMVKKPGVFLMDEPLSNLDAKLRSQLRTDLIELHNRLGSTFVYVTHDQVEAMSMGTQIVLMNKGKIMQCGTPHTIYHDPDNVFTAQFIGTPPMNILKQNQVHYEHLPVENSCYLGFRPEYVTFYEDVPDEKQKGLIIDGKVITHEMLGIETLYKIDTCYGRIQAKIFDDKKAVDGNVKMFIPHNRILYFDEEEQRIR
mgnify:CR=1 FL=1